MVKTIAETKAKQATRKKYKLLKNWNKNLLRARKRRMSKKIDVKHEENKKNKIKKVMEQSKTSSLEEERKTNETL